MAVPAPFEFSDRDYAATLVALQAKVALAFPTWTDFNVASFGNTLLESFAFIADILAAYQDDQSAESRISTAQRRRSAIGLLKLIGYEMPGATAALVVERFTIPTVETEDVVIPAGTIVATREAVPTEFELVAAATILAGTLFIDGNVENSKLQTGESFTMDGSANQQIRLAQTPFLDKSTAAANGGFVKIGAEQWTEVDNFLLSLAASTHYQVVVDENDRAFLRFGDGVTGKSPNGNMEVQYKTGGGIVGNVEANSIKEIRGSFATTGGKAVTVTVNNTLIPSIQGTDRQTVAVARIKGPGSLRGLNRTVSRQDFMDNGALVTGVGRILAMTKNENVAIAENTTSIYVVPTAGGLPDANLRAAVLLMFTTTRPATLTHVVNVVTFAVNADLYVTINVAATVYLEANAVAATVKTAITAALTAHFAPLKTDGTPNLLVNFGNLVLDELGVTEPEVRYSDIWNVINDVAGIRKLGTPDAVEAMLLNGNDANVAVAAAKFPELGTITLTNGDTSGPL